MVYLRQNKKAHPRVQTSITISPEFYDMCQKHRISISEATRVGISILLAERDVLEYDNRLNITRKLNEAKQKTLHYAKECYDLKEKLEKKMKELNKNNRNEDGDNINAHSNNPQKALAEADEFINNLDKLEVENVSTN